MSGAYGPFPADDLGISSQQVVSQVVSDVQAGLSASAAANSQSQADARRFIQENGADVVGGHSPVNPATSAFMTHYGHQAPTGPQTAAPEYDAGTD